MIHARCPKNPSHDKFVRPIQVVAETREIVDPCLMVIDVESPRELRMTRRFTGTNCVIDGAQAVITIA